MGYAISGGATAQQGIASISFPGSYCRPAEGAEEVSLISSTLVASWVSFAPLSVPHNSRRFQPSQSDTLHYGVAFNTSHIRLVVYADNNACIRCDWPLSTSPCSSTARHYSSSRVSQCTLSIDMSGVFLLQWYTATAEYQKTQYLSTSYRGQMEKSLRWKAQSPSIAATTHRASHKRPFFFTCNYVQRWQSAPCHTGLKLGLWLVLRRTTSSCFNRISRLAC